MQTVFSPSLFSDDDFSAPAAISAPAPAKKYKVPEVKLSYVREKFVKYTDSVVSSEHFNKIFRMFYDDGEIDFRESVFVAYCTHSNKIIGVQRLGTGTEAASICDIKALFAGALLCRASSFAICHNHPSGTLRTSPADDRLTRRVKEIAQIHELQFLDHLILTSEGYFSYRDEGYL